ncbi:hypothetical protein AQUCO_00400042v1 [Aquilegia coerulea]|uniref:Uncharacterized protein n=1 Tax=Aquilegia coerulea TaxID=218851 RepID=A0A2G5ET34_AQUCA|nr:hypothetical protein AQUCO_00400042v1 [Aquilegia coerulea]
MNIYGHTIFKCIKLEQNVLKLSNLQLKCLLNYLKKIYLRTNKHPTLSASTRSTIKNSDVCNSAYPKVLINASHPAFPPYSLISCKFYCKFSCFVPFFSICKLRILIIIQKVKYIIRSQNKTRKRL